MQKFLIFLGLKIMAFIKSGTVTRQLPRNYLFLSIDLEDFKDLPNEPERESSGAKFNLFFLMSNLEFSY